MLGNPSNVIYSDINNEVCLSIPNSSGVSQGNPLSTFLFNLTQAKPLKNNFLLSFHDDHFIVGNPEDALNVTAVLEFELRLIGLQLSHSKSKIWSPTPFSEDAINLATQANLVPVSLTEASS
jgi:hypothetical protein